MLDKFRKKIEQVAPLIEEEWKDISKYCEVKHIKKKEILVHYGKLSKDIYYIASGSFEISLISKNDGPKTVWFFLDEIFDIALCADSVYLDEPTKYEITALEDSIVIKLNCDKAEDLVKKHPGLNEFARKDAMNDFIATTEIRNHMISHTPKEFIDYLKKKYPFILERIPDKNIARFMGITPEWYSKMKKSLLAESK